MTNQEGARLELRLEEGERPVEVVPAVCLDIFVVGRRLANGEEERDNLIEGFLISP
jgi:hypothetical protein